VLKPGQSHDYVSGCPLATPNGSMEGHYTFRRHDGSELRVAIPHFPSRLLLLPGKGTVA
jgi:ApaG protein